ncbi:MAG: alpha-L-fucosidase [Clostridiales bacterium]|nr:alpha-L-fucosidase [Clostridiales bacterium]
MYTTKKTQGNTEWFVQDRFGLFIHFGLYALPARHEWIKQTDMIPEEKYEQYFKYFNPDMLDPRDWARQAKNAGMKYAILTTKHHEGFCLFDTKYTDYKITNTQYGKDLVKEYVDAFRAEGLKIGFYYSLLDWHHPDFTIDQFHPRRYDANAKELNEGRDMHRYAEYMRNQVRELLTNYGKIDIIWFDFSYSKNEQPRDWMKGKGKEDWEAEKLIALVRSLQPDIIINNRTEIEQDIVTPEQVGVEEWPKDKETGERLVWEACHTLSGSWGYYRDETSWKSPEMLISLLIKIVSRGGNLIMNVGPTSRGFFDYRAENALKTYGEWMKYNCKSIYNCTMADPEFTEPNGCRLTQSNDGKRLYIHLLDYPFSSVVVPGLGGKVDYVQFLHDGSELLFNDVPANSGDEAKTAVSIGLPILKPNVVVPVIEVFLKDR